MKKKHKVEFQETPLLGVRPDIVGIGKAKLNGTWITSKIDLEYLTQAIDCLKKLGIEAVEIAWSNDAPVLLGKVDNEKNTAIGVWISPIVRDFDEEKDVKYV